MANILIRTDDETRYALKEAAKDCGMSMNTYILRLLDSTKIINRLVRELSEVVEYTRVENAPLRAQEIESIESVIAMAERAEHEVSIEEAPSAHG
jgi:hypothetical protein